MSPVALSLIVFICVFGGVLLGMFLRKSLPQDHLSADSKGAVNLGIGMIGTMAALVLGLLVAAAWTFYSSQKDELTSISAKLVMLDRLLAHYGPESQGARAELRGRVTVILDRVFRSEHSGRAPQAPGAGAEVLYDQIQQLAPQNDTQRSIKGAALNVAMEIGSTRWLMFEQESFPIPKGLLIVVVFWFTVVFASFGLHAPRNSTVMVTLFLCAVSVAGAILLILELYNPFGGLLHISSAPLENALAQLGK
ncbi:MAG TPA: hypothetical protein VKL40_03770 [Candidatus Angelobacter sp.]|nr:hypothetical protein [Candidatus Angelobacter sp.]